ncbi:MAG: DUF3991 and TOPRIM domain-containing protein [Oscillospiraceae bacterium]
MNDYYHYSDTQISAAKQTDMTNFLEQNEGFSFKKAGNEWHCVEHNSLVIMADKTGWAWNSKNICGANAIDYCIKIKNMNFKQSLQIIVGKGSMGYIKAVPTAVEKTSLKLPEKSKDYRRAFAYLNKSRGIDANIISQLMHEEKIYQDSKNNVVFVGLDSENKPAFACVRGTISNSDKADKPAFRGDCLGSDKRFSFCLEGKKKSSVFVFEAPIDLLSHATMANLATKKSDAWKFHTRIALAGKSDLALEEFLKSHTEIKEIYVCLDNDAAGQRATQEIISKYEKLGYSMVNLPPKIGKDYNDNLLNIEKNFSYSAPQISEKTLQPER